MQVNPIHERGLLTKFYDTNSFSGFDPEGAAELKHKLVGTKKWIGAAGKSSFKVVTHVFSLPYKQNYMLHFSIEGSRVV